MIWPFGRKQKQTEPAPAIKQVELTASTPEMNEKFMSEHIERIEQSRPMQSVVFLTPYNDKNAKPQGLDLQTTVDEAYKKDATVYAGVETVAQNGSSVPWILRKKEKNENNQYEIMTDHKKYPLIRLLDRPSRRISAKRFFHTVFQRLMCCGNCLAYKVKVGKEVRELILLNPDHLTYKDNGLEITEYVGKPGSPLAGKRYDPDDIVHWMLPDPANPFWGHSPLYAVALAIDVDRKIAEWWNNTLEKGCKKDAIIKYKHALKKREFTQIRAQLEQQVAGFRAGRGFMVLGNEAEVEFLDYDPADLDFINSRKQTKNIISTGMRIPPPMVGDQQAQSVYGNMREARQSFWLEMLLPILAEVRDTMNVSLLADFGLDEFEYNIDFDTSDVESLQALFHEKIKASTLMHAMGYPINMVNKRMDLEMPYVEGGDQPFISANLLPLLDLGKERVEGRDATSTSTSPNRGVDEEDDQEEEE